MWINTRTRSSAPDSDRRENSELRHITPLSNKLIVCSSIPPLLYSLTPLSFYPPKRRFSVKRQNRQQLPLFIWRTGYYSPYITLHYTERKMSALPPSNPSRAVAVYCASSLGNQDAFSKAAICMLLLIFSLSLTSFELWGEELVVMAWGCWPRLTDEVCIYSAWCCPCSRWSTSSLWRWF